MKSSIRICIKAFYYAIIVFVCFEISLLLAGFRPYKNKDYRVHSTPSYPFRGSDQLGFCLNAGEFDITLNNEVKFSSKHSKDGCRVSKEDAESKMVENMAFLGCSFTYGYGVNYNETFTSKIQTEINQLWIKNYAVPGYGTVQSYLQLPSILKTNNSSNIVLFISSVHLERNTLSKQYRSNLKIGFANSSKDIEGAMKGAKFPFMRDSTMKVLYDDWNDLYSNYFLRSYLSSSNFIQNTLDRISDGQLESAEVTTGILRRMNVMCLEKGVRFFVVCLDDSAEMKDVEHSLTDIPWLNVSFDFTNEDLTLLPIDSHPNAKGHSYISAKVIQFLTDNLIEDE